MLVYAKIVRFVLLPGIYMQSGAFWDYHVFVLKITSRSVRMPKSYWWSPAPDLFHETSHIWNFVEVFPAWKSTADGRI